MVVRSHSQSLLVVQPSIGSSVSHDRTCCGAGSSSLKWRSFKRTVGFSSSRSLLVLLWRSTTTKRLLFKSAIFFSFILFRSVAVSRVRTPSPILNGRFIEDFVPLIRLSCSGEIQRFTNWNTSSKFFVSGRT